MIKKCKRCGHYPKVEVPQFKGLYGDMPLMLRPCGPIASDFEIEQFNKNNPPYIWCPTCRQLDMLELHIDLIDKWNKEQE